MVPTPMPDPTAMAEAHAIAEQRAAEDRELLAALKAKREAEPPEQEPFTVSEQPRVPMNRADRRRQVKLYAMVLAGTERQTPVRNATVIPRAERRHRKHHRRGNAH